jgi:hypothetical protein
MEEARNAYRILGRNTYLKATTWETATGMGGWHMFVM